MLGGGARSILVVEDDDVLRGFMAAVLTEAGYCPHVVASPEAAQGTYDLVVADYLAPAYAPGAPWPFLDALRGLSGGAPILGFTGHREALSDLPSSLGVNAVAVKPFDLDELLSLINQLLADHPRSAGAPSVN